MEIFNWDLEKVSVVIRCPLRTVHFIEISLQGFYVKPICS